MIRSLHFQILAEEAHPVENLDASAAREVLSKAQSQLSSASTEEVRQIFLCYNVLLYFHYDTLRNARDFFHFRLEQKPL